MKTTTKDRVIGRNNTNFGIRDLIPHGPRPALLATVGAVHIYESQYDMQMRLTKEVGDSLEPRHAVRLKRKPKAE